MHFLLSYFYELRSQKMRMFLTIMGVAWGMANIALLLSVGEGFYRVVHDGMAGMGEGIVVVWPQQSSRTYRGFNPGRDVHVSEEDVARAATLPSIAAISAEYQTWGVRLKNREREIDTERLVRGVYPVYGAMRNLYPEPGGRFMNVLDEKNRRRVIFIGNEVRDLLYGEGADAVGRTLWVNGSPFTVIGVMRHKYQMSMYNGSDASAAFIPASTFRTMFNRLWVNNVLMAPVSEGESKTAQEDLRKQIAGTHGFHPDDTAIFSNWDTMEQQKIQSMVFRGLKIFLGIMGGMTLFIAGLGVANIMYVTIRERTREIGIKMAVGAHPAHIVVQFLIEALLTVSIGGALGVGMALGLMRLFALVPMPDEFLSVMGRPEPVFSGMVALVCITVLNIVGLMAGLFPARRASLIDPVEALRYE